MVLLVPFLLVTASVLTLQAGAIDEWISRPNSRLYINAGETARINWKFVTGALAVTYDKKRSSYGKQKTRIANIPYGSSPKVVKSYQDKIRVEKSGALNITNASLADEGFYLITITYPHNTVNDEVEIKIQDAPVITSFPTHSKNDIYYAGMSIKLVCMTKGRPVPEVRWFKDDMENPLEKSTGTIVYKIKSASKKDSGKYTCLASNQAGKANRTIEFIIYRRPYDIDFVHNTALDGTIFEGESVMFTCSAKGSPSIRYYKLLHNGRTLIKTANGVYKINEVKNKDNGTYSCVPMNKAGLGQNKTIVLRVQARPNYWKEKLKRSTSPPPEVETVVTFVDTTAVPSTEVSEPTKVGFRGAGRILHSSILLSTTLPLFLIVIRLA